MSKDRRNATSEDLKNEVLAKINDYQENGFPEAGRLHELIMQANPNLSPRLWYGMPGYAKTKDSAVLCFFRKDTLISFGFTEAIDLAVLQGENDSFVPSAWYVLKLDKKTENTIVELVSKVS